MIIYFLFTYKVKETTFVVIFANGSNSSTECFEKIEFSSSLEYYNYYLGLEELKIDNKIIKKMVKDYITGIEWCINYYLNDCISWKWGYNFPIAPMITDIINYYPTKIEIHNLNTYTILCKFINSFTFSILNTQLITILASLSLGHDPECN